MAPHMPPCSESHNRRAGRERAHPSRCGHEMATPASGERTGATTRPRERRGLLGASPPRKDSERKYGPRFSPRSRPVRHVEGCAWALSPKWREALRALHAGGSERAILDDPWRFLDEVPGIWARSAELRLREAYAALEAAELAGVAQGKLGRLERGCARATAAYDAARALSGRLRVCGGREDAAGDISAEVDARAGGGRSMDRRMGGDRWVKGVCAAPGRAVADPAQGRNVRWAGVWASRDSPRARIRDAPRCHEVAGESARRPISRRTQRPVGALKSGPATDPSHSPATS